MESLNGQTVGLQELSANELKEITGGDWIGDTAHFIGFSIGYLGHAVIEAAKFVAHR